MSTEEVHTIAVRCRLGHLLSLPIAAVALLTFGTAVSQTYTLIDLGTLGGSTSVASAINNANQVVGWSTNADGATRPFLWNINAMSDLGSLGSNGFAYGINSSGQVVGYSSTPNALWPDCGRGGGSCLESFDQATLWTNGAITGLGTLGGPNSHAFSINDAGQVVGTADLPLGPDGIELPDGFLYTAGTMADLGAFDPSGINDVGTIAGSSPGTINIWPVPTLWNAGTVTTLPPVDPLGGGTAVALSSSKSVVPYVAGTSMLNPYGASHATLWTNGVPTDLGTLDDSARSMGGDISYALGVNVKGTVVGRSVLPPIPTESGELFHATLWAAGPILDLNNLLDPTTPNLATIELTDARAVNDNGWIVANDANSQRAYLLVPQLATLTIVPTTLTFASQAVGTSTAARVVTLTNTGPTPFTFDAPQTSNDYAQTNDCASALPPGASCSFNVTFMPESLGAHPSALILGSASTKVAVSLMGVGAIAITLKTSSATTLVRVPVTLSWAATSGVTCMASGGRAGDGWTGSLADSGSKSVIELTVGQYAYGITCNGVGQTAQAHAAVAVDMPPNSSGGGAVDILSLVSLLTMLGMQQRRRLRSRGFNGVTDALVCGRSR